MSQIIDLIEQLNEKEYEYYLKHEEYFDEKGLVDPSKN